MRRVFNLVPKQMKALPMFKDVCCNVTIIVCYQITTIETGKIIMPVGCCA